MTGREEPLMDALIRAHPPEVDGMCPDANVLNAYVEHRLEADARAPVERHLAGCEECAFVVETLADDVVDVPLESGSRPATWPVWATAAAILLGLTTALVLGLGSDPAPKTLEDTIAQLRAEDPHRFETLRVPTRADFEAAAAPVMRGGITIQWPLAQTTRTRPTLRWKPVPGASQYRVTIMDADFSADVGIWMWDTEGAEFAWPASAEALVPLRDYFITVSTETPLGEVEGTRRVSVSDRSDIDAITDSIRAAAADETQGALLSAAWLFGQGLYEEARAALEGVEDERARELHADLCKLIGEDDC